MQLVVHPSGVKSFVLLTRINGRQINIRIGDASVLTLAQAREEARRKLAEIAAGQDPRAARKEAERAESETVKTVVEQFIERHVRPKNRTAGEIERKFQTEVLPRWGPGQSDRSASAT